MNVVDLKAMSMAELNDVAATHNIGEHRSLRRQELIFQILQSQAAQSGQMFAEGVLEIMPDGFGFLRSPLNSYLSGPDDIYISPSQIKRFYLKTGDTGFRPGPAAERLGALLRAAARRDDQLRRSRRVQEEDQLRRPRAPFPESRFNLEYNPKDVATRIMNLLTPIGKGQRGLIVAPPRTGKTVLLKSIANAYSAQSSRGLSHRAAHR